MSAVSVFILSHASILCGASCLWFMLFFLSFHERIVLRIFLWNNNTKKIHGPSQELCIHHHQVICRGSVRPSLSDKQSRSLETTNFSASPQEWHKKKPRWTPRSLCLRWTSFSPTSSSLCIPVTLKSSQQRALKKPAISPPWPGRGLAKPCRTEWKEDGKGWRRSSAVSTRARVCASGSPSGQSCGGLTSY